MRRTLLLVLVAAGVVSCAPPVDDPGLDFRANVAVESVERGAIERVLETTGTVRAAEDATIVVETAGALTLLRNPRTGRPWAIGDEIRRGEVVAVIDPQEAATTARIASRQRSLEAARAEHERNQQLRAEGLISTQALSESEVKLANARADFENARVQEAKSRLESPITGVLTDVTRVSAGTFQGSGARVAQAMAFDEVIVDLDLGTGDVLDVTPGQPVRVTTYSSGDVFEGEVLRIAPAIDPKTRTFRVEVLVPNPDSRLRPGMFVSAEIVLERREDVIVVDPDAVVTRDGSSAVFVVEAQRATLRSVSLGLVAEDTVEITDGLAEGERVVVTGQQTLRDDTRVIVRN